MLITKENVKNLHHRVFLTDFLILTKTISLTLCLGVTRIGGREREEKRGGKREYIIGGEREVDTFPLLGCREKRRGKDKLLYELSVE